MLISHRVEIAVTGVLVRRDQINLVADRLVHEAIERSHICVFDHLADNVAFPADRADDWNPITTQSRFTAFLIPVPICVLTTNISFVHSHDAHKLPEAFIVHRSAQAMAHIPSSAIITATYLPLNLKCTDTFFTVEHLPEHFKPNLKRIVDILEDCSGDYRETVSVSLSALFVRALPFPRHLDLVDAIRLAASRACDVCRLANGDSSGTVCMHLRGKAPSTL